MQYKAIFVTLAAMALAIVIYSAGYREGLRRHSVGVVAAAPTSGESDRMRPGPSTANEIATPIEGLKFSELQDTFSQQRPGGRRHEALDILAPRGTPVHAVTDGVIKKLFLSKAGGITIYQFDTAGVYCYYYAHLDHYAEGLHEGQGVRQWDVIGYVGTTGNADVNTPHLNQLGPEKQWWRGTPIDPYPILERVLER